MPQFVWILFLFNGEGNNEVFDLETYKDKDMALQRAQNLMAERGVLPHLYKRLVK